MFEVELVYVLVHPSALCLRLGLSMCLRVLDTVGCNSTVSKSDCIQNGDINIIIYILYTVALDTVELNLTVHKNVNILILNSNTSSKANSLKKHPRIIIKNSAYKSTHVLLSKIQLKKAPTYYHQKFSLKKHPRIIIKNFCMGFQNSFGYLVEREEIVHVSEEEYKAFIKPEATIQVYLKGTVKETKKSYAHSETLSLTKPSLKMEVRKFNQTMQRFSLKFVFIGYVAFSKSESISTLW